MALPKAEQLIVALLVIFFGLDKQECHLFRNVFLKESVEPHVSATHFRQKRASVLNSSDYVVQIVISSSDVEFLKKLLNILNFPLAFNNTITITSINTTGVCFPNETGFQCRCEENFAWSYSSCITYEACDAFTGNTCGCINALPEDGQFCQLNISTTPVPVTTEQPATKRLFDILLELQAPSIDQFRLSLKDFMLPLNISQSVAFTNISLTTVCFSNSTGGLECQCEDQFGWACDKCETSGSCSNATTETCGCIYGLPSDGQFCQPITSVIPCPTTTTSVTTMESTTTMAPNTTLTSTINSTTPNTTLTSTTKSTTTTPNTTLTSPKSTTTTPNTTLTSPKSTTTTPNTTLTSTIKSTTTIPKTTLTSTTKSTKSTTPTTTMTTPPTTPTVIQRNFEFTMDLQFQDVFNNKTSEIFQDVDNAIKRQSERFIGDLVSAELNGFRSGSTIAEYTIRASTFITAEIESVQMGIRSDLEDKYHIITDSTTLLQFTPGAFFGKEVTISCHPPPEYNSTWSFKWTFDGTQINENDRRRTVFIENGLPKLRVTPLFFTDSGLYECFLRNGRVYRQNGTLNVADVPLIQAYPLRTNTLCEDGNSQVQVQLSCSVQSPYEVELKQGENSLASGPGLITHVANIDCGEEEEELFTCQEKTNPQFKNDLTVVISRDRFVCVNDSEFGDGKIGDNATTSCKPDEIGQMTAVCKTNGSSGVWGDRQDSCILKPIQELLTESEFLNDLVFPVFVDKLSNVTVNFAEDVVKSPTNINAIVEILNNVANTASVSSVPINQTVMEDILITIGVLTLEEAKKSWDVLNANATRKSTVTRSQSPKSESVSSVLLFSLETITNGLTNDSFDIVTPHIQLNKTTFTDSFRAHLNSSVEINITESDAPISATTIITFASMDNVLPARNTSNATNNIINGRVILVISNATISNISFSFDTINNETLVNPQCVFWNFSLFNGLGGWDNEGCELVSYVNETVTCNCNHLTSFSVLMSPYVPNLPPYLDYITYIGVGISMGSLVICLIIEAVIWRKISRNSTSYLRHVSIVNIAVSLLIADVWFIIGGAISSARTENQPACTAATFFIHFFYLALFFWMLASGLLLLYRTVNVFGGDLSERSMLAIGFCIGYGMPLIIVFITIAVTAPNKEYTKEFGFCWLNWSKSKALLSFVVPALTIVFINLFILIVVMYKMLRRRAVGNAAQVNERNVLCVIIRSVAVLTPFFGTTWGLGLGLLFQPESEGLHVAFAFFNSLQGFFILVFGTLLDKKVRSELAAKSRDFSGTRSSSAGNSSSGLGFLWKWRRGRDGYNVNSASASGVTYSYTNSNA
ncbi:hypothetical protein LDENG_00151870 [Lucifuga dentata]|nr:hypothetical protein LDENG_00151870 [Lucifuga dentata]